VIMKMRTAMLGFALIAALSVGWGAINPDRMTKIACSDLHFSAAFLQRYPHAPEACIDARQDQSGAKWAKFRARVFLNSSDRTTVNLLDSSGAMKTTFSFRPRAGATISLNGRNTRITSLRPGDELDFWVPESKMTAGAMPEPTEQSWQVLPPLESQQ
jgi:hypothetical protein